MPRRPRPTSRLNKPTNPTPIANAGHRGVKAKHLSQTALAHTLDERESDSDQASDEESDAPAPEISLEEDQDIDGPRVAQWVDEDELDQEVGEDAVISEDEQGEESDVERINMDSLKDDLASLPLGALRAAQRTLVRTQAENDSESESESESEDESPSEAEVKKAEKPEWSNKPRTDISKRKNKHAPTEVTSKKPVTRRRKIIEVPKVDVRDPRFLPFTGQLKPEIFRKQYDFLSEMHTTEMKTLKDNLKRARKLLASSPRHLREEREQEVARLDSAVKRAESNVNKDKREKIEQEALSKAVKEEREKRKEGKGAWFMKDSDKKQMLVRARYDALAAAGGKGAVKKAIERKQKKVGQKEKKRRPFGADGGKQSRKRTYEDDGNGQRKRRKTG